MKKLIIEEIVKRVRGGVAVGIARGGIIGGRTYAGGIIVLIVDTEEY